jgi:hypothetical protein
MHQVTAVIVHGVWQYYTMHPYGIAEFSSETLEADLDADLLTLPPCLFVCLTAEEPYVHARHSVTYTNPMGRVSIPRLDQETIARASIISVSTQRL